MIFLSTERKCQLYGKAGLLALPLSVVFAHAPGNLATWSDVSSPMPDLPEDKELEQHDRFAHGGPQIHRLQVVSIFFSIIPI